MMTIVCGLGLVSLGFDAPETATIRLNVTHLRSDRGRVNVSLYRSEDGFPGDASRSFKTVRASIQGGKSEVVFADVPSGEYAVALLHDENNNDRLDTHWTGLPKEGYGVSNNARATLGPPRYANAKFRLEKPGVQLEIKVKYL